MGLNGFKHSIMKALNIFSITSFDTGAHFNEVSVDFTAPFKYTV